MNLPKGLYTLEDIHLIEMIINDKNFIDSIEFDCGKIERIYPDWKKNKIVYEFLNGDTKKSDIPFLLEAIKKFSYHQEIKQ